MYGQPHTATIPTVGVTAGPQYATDINAALAEIRATLNAKVTPAGMDLNAALSLLSGGVYSPITDIERAHFQNKSAAINATTYPRALYAVNGELYFNDGAGNQVQVTNAGVLNLAATGGITGAGYGSGGVTVAWDAGAGAYRFKTGSGADQYAALIADDILLRDGSSHAWRISSPALAADLNLQLPAAYPGATSLLQMSSAGVVSASNSVPALTALAGITGSANQHFTVSGTGRFKHGDIAFVLGAPLVLATAGATPPTRSASNSPAPVFGSGCDGYASWTLQLPVGSRIRSVTFTIDNTTVGTSGSIIYSLTRTTTGVVDTVSTTTDSTNDDNDVVLSAIDHTVVDDCLYTISALVTGVWDRVATIKAVSVVIDQP